MTTTVQNILDRSVRLIGELNSGESLTVQETADALVTLNAMLDSWRNDKLMCFAIRDESITLSSGNQTRTIGPTGNLVSDRPIKIDTAYIVYSNTSSDVRILQADEYAAITTKLDTSTYPLSLYYEPDIPNGTLYLYPIPNASSVLHILTWTPVLAFASAATTVTLPPGWEEAMATNLALAVSAEYETEPRQMVFKMAQTSLANIKRANSRPIRAYTELAALVGRHRSHILTDQP